MRVIRFFFWLSVSVILAYFMSDVKINGKTIKQTIDEFLGSVTGQKVQESATELLGSGLDTTIEAMNRAKAGLVERGERLREEVVVETSEEISVEDRRELKEVLKESRD